jgi:LysM repeat protein
VGRRGWDVASLEYRLRALGLLRASSVDGRFTAATAAALRRFQSSNGLTPDGIAGTGTFRALARATPARATTRRKAAAAVHVVQPGEGLIAIASRYRVSVPALLRANDLGLASVIVPGQRLRLPGGAVAAPSSTGSSGTSSSRAHVVAPGEGLILIARRYGVSPTLLASTNGLTLQSVIVPGQRLSIPSGAVGSSAVHVVQAGESWFLIAQRYRVSPHDLASVNASRLDAVIVPGQRLTLPSGADLSAAPESAASRNDVRSSLDHWSAVYGVDPKLVRAVAWMESGWQQSAVSDIGAVGVMQLLPETWAWVESYLIGEATTRDADGNVRAGVRFLRWQLEHFDGDVDLALAGWYQGAAAVRRIGLYDDTKQFVSVVKALYGRV